MYDTMKTMKCFNKEQKLLNSHQVFQKGILMSITSVKVLRKQMEKNELQVFADSPTQPGLFRKFFQSHEIRERTK